MSPQMPLIVTKIIGGLGNQLFQYAFGLFISRSLNGELVLDVDGFKNYSLHKFELSKLGIKFEQADPASLRPIDQFGRTRYSRGITRRLIRLQNRFGLVKDRYLRDEDYPISLESLKNSKWIYLDGYWQRHDYLNTVRDAILSQIQVPKGDYSQAFNSVAVHIRRGDYVSDSKTNSLLGVLPQDYYIRAFAELTRILGTKPLPIIFSDDPNWVRASINLDPNQVIVERGDTTTDFFKMSHCDHQIIANSTFSWWAAFLNQNSKKHVIAPAHWFCGRLDGSEFIIPKDWIRM